MEKILIIEDDEMIAEIEKDYLEINDYEVDICGEGISGIEKALTGVYDLIILDLMLPGMDGYQVCKKLRASLDTPIIIVSAKNESADQILGLGLGADDFVTKPFDPSLLVARVKANISQSRRGKETWKEKTVTAGPFILHTDTRTLTKDGEVIQLKNKEYELMELFIRNKNIVFTKDGLYEKVWGMSAEGDTSTVSVHINRLRQKIEDDPSEPAYLQTVWSVGYRFSVK